MARYNTALSLVVALLVFCYFIIFAAAYPSAELQRAIALEVVIFVIVFAVRFKQARSKSAQTENMVMAELSDKWNWLKFWRKQGSAIVAGLWLCAALFLIVDLTALTAAWLGNYGLARAIYEHEPLVPGAHPAYSMEILTGAYIEAGTNVPDKNASSKIERGRELTRQLVILRKQMFGVDSELYAGIIADSANLYRKEGNFAKAEELSKEALAISRRVFKNTTMGKILTQVGDNLRDQGKYVEAEKYYQEALAMRQKQFGGGSVKVAETLVEYARLKRATGDQATSQTYQQRADAIFKRHEKNDDPFSNALVTIGFFIGSIVVTRLLFGPKGYLTAMAIKRMQVRLDQRFEADVDYSPGRNSDKDRDDLSKLIKFYENQKDEERVRKYQSMLASINRE